MVDISIVISTFTGGYPLVLGLLGHGLLLLEVWAGWTSPDCWRREAILVVSWDREPFWIAMSVDLWPVWPVVTAYMNDDLFVTVCVFSWLLVWFSSYTENDIYWWLVNLICVRTYFGLRTSSRNFLPKDISRFSDRPPPFWGWGCLLTMPGPVKKLWALTFPVAERFRNTSMSAISQHPHHASWNCICSFLHRCNVTFDKMLTCFAEVCLLCCQRSLGTQHERFRLGPLLPWFEMDGCNMVEELRVLSGWMVVEMFIQNP